MADKPFHKSLLLLLLIVIDSLDRSLSIEPSSDICRQLCSDNRTHASDVSKCLNSCSEARGSNLPQAISETDDSEHNHRIKRPGTSFPWTKASWNKFHRIGRETDSLHSVGPYQRRPHYLRIGRSGRLREADVGIVKRARPSHYLRIGRDPVDENYLNDEELMKSKRGRPSNYLRIGRSYVNNNAVDDKYLIENKRGRPSNNLRIGRGFEKSNAMNEEVSDKNKRGRSSNYLRIGRDNSESQTDVGPDKRASRSSHYLRIGRNSEPVAEEAGIQGNKKRASHYLRMGRIRDSESYSPRMDIKDDIKRVAVPQNQKISWSGVSRESRRSKPSHYLRIGRNSIFGSDEGNTLEASIPASTYEQLSQPYLHYDTNRI